MLVMVPIALTTVAATNAEVAEVVATGAEAEVISVMEAVVIITRWCQYF
jgi:hypothetical protein